MDSELVSASRESMISMVEATGMKDSRPTVKLRRGYTCCVPGCYSNSKQEKHLSFYMIPKDKILQTKWLNAIKKKTLHLVNTIACAHCISGWRENGNNWCPQAVSFNT